MFLKVIYLNLKNIFTINIIKLEMISQKNLEFNKEEVVKRLETIKAWHDTIKPNLKPKRK